MSHFVLLYYSKVLLNFVIPAKRTGILLRTPISLIKRGNLPIAKTVRAKCMGAFEDYVNL